MLASDDGGGLGGAVELGQVDPGNVAAARRNNSVEIGEAACPSNRKALRSRGRAI